MSITSSRLKVLEFIGDSGVKLFIRLTDSVDKEVCRALFGRKALILSSED
jgi:hypothetical protein